MRVRVRELEEREKKESKKLADEDALRKIRVAEDTIEHLQKKLGATKQVFKTQRADRVKHDAIVREGVRRMTSMPLNSEKQLLEGGGGGGSFGCASLAQLGPSRSRQGMTRRMWKVRRAIGQTEIS